jgi:predicted ATPase/transcriptional regulator with XRE-family HTH domain
MKAGAPGSFGAHLKALRETAGFTQEELATIAGLSVHAVSALERGERRRPHVDTVRALSAALDLSGPARDALLASARGHTNQTAVDELSGASLPLPLTTLLGRDAELQTLGGWLADPIARLITLVGPGGVGKTRLALEIARTVADQGSIRVVFVPLAGVNDAAFVPASIADGFGLSNLSATDLTTRLRAASEDQPTLLILDNCEHVLDAAPLVADLLTSAASLRLLATSRAPLRVRGEREYAVGPLAIELHADSFAPADLARIPAVQLFVERVRDAQPAFRLTVANAGTVAAICRRLDALPLALELAAPWMKVLPAEDLYRRLEHDVLFSTAGPRDLPERQQTMSATIGWSYRLLDPTEQRAFRRFGALPGRFPIEAAAAVLAGADDEQDSPATYNAIAAVAGLIEKSLLLRADATVVNRPLYQMLETVRAYASLELVTANERDDAMEGLARYCKGEAARAATGLVGSSQAEWLDRVRGDLETYRIALAWLIDHNRAAEACDITWHLQFFWLIRGRAAEGIGWFERCLSVLPLLPSVESRALVGAAAMLFAQGELSRARTGATRALALDAVDMDVAVMAGHLLGHVEHAHGNLEAARERFLSSAKGFDALSIHWGVGNALIGQAGIALADGDVEQGERLLDGATSVLRHAGPWFLNMPLYIRAINAVRRGKADETIALVRESLVSSRTLHDKFAFVYALTPLAAAAVLKGDHAWAARVLGARDAVVERTGAASIDRSVKELRERIEEEARERLGPDRWARAFGAGRSASIDSLLKDIDRGGR